MGSRREFLSAALVGLAPKSGRNIQGGFVLEAQQAGHRLRDGQARSAPKETLRVPVVIVGGGMAGLSAAWRLEKRGFRDFVVLEMEREAGGNSRWGENEVSPYPWAAHYIPVPNRESALVREVLEEFGVLRDGVYEERYLCFSPQERLYLHGRWHEGLEPELGVTRKDHEQFARFAERMKEFRASGQFTIPMEIGAKPSPLDGQPMTEWMKASGFDSPYLQWYVDYSCRDDYGSAAKDTSAWAGIHYFAAREHDEKGPLTWPEGNGWLLRRMLEKLRRHVRTGSMVERITREGQRVKVRTPQAVYLAERVIFAAPTFLARYLMDEAEAPRAGFVYSPWLTANLTLDRMPREKGAPISWDNVIYGSPSLGYVSATHMSLKTRHEKTVWTYYWALAERPAAEARKYLLANDWDYWKEAILNDLQRAHADIRECVERIDIFRIGHAMASPLVGKVFAPERLRLAKMDGPVVFANSDLSSLSIFEEAQYRGVVAADRVLRALGKR